MESISFKTVIPESGIVRIPHNLFKKFIGHPTEIIIQEVNEQEKTSKIRALKGKYRHLLSLTDDFCRCKAYEKTLEL